jgi:arylsulfatase A-like enzyme
MTGLSPETHGVVVDGRRLSRAALTLAEVLRSAGYATAGFVSGPYLRAEYGFYQGFDHYDDYSVELHQPPLADMPVMNASHRWVTGPPLAEAFTTWLEQWSSRGRDRPFFAFVHQWDVHYDYLPPPPHDAVFDADYTGTAGGRYEDMTKAMSDRDLAHVIALYDGEIRFTDELLENLLGVVQRLGLLDDTIVVVTADHGEEFYEHGVKGHRHQLYDESILVPLVLRYPAALPAGVRVDDQVRLMDVPHTVLELAEVDVPEGFGAVDGKRGTQLGRTLVELIGHPPAPPLPAFGSLENTKYFLRTGRYKFLLDVTNSREEVYDLQADPGERTNLASTHPELTTRLRGELQSWLSAIADVNVAERFDPGEHHREQLRNLGYIE